MAEKVTTVENADVIVVQKEEKTTKVKTPRKSTRNSGAKTKTAASKNKNQSTKVLPEISFIIPILDMDTYVDDLYADILKSMEKNKAKFEILFVDDASSDGTWKRLDEIAQKDKKVKLLRMRNTFGEASCFDAGLKHAKGEKIVYSAARVRVDMTKMGALLARLDEGNDLVVGWRWPRKDSEMNQKISGLFNALVHKIGKLKLHDINSSVFVTRKSMLEKITFYGNLNIFLPILASRKGYKVVEEKIEQMPGKFRQSKYPNEYFQRVLDIISVVFLTRYSKRPLHFLGFFGMSFTVAGLALNIYLFLYRILGFGGIAGRPLLLLGALLLIIGLQMISIGLIGEMIIYTHAREIKEYNIEMVVGE
ncbi:MAG: glycosyltransferase [Calditrichaeota bacterium]|nr:MAG: glycosyltransferase [Calditrichota bacterium]